MSEPIQTLRNAPPEGPFVRLLSRRFVPACIFAAVAALLYGFTLSFPFVFDDDIYLVDNPLVQDAKSFGYLGDFKNFATYPKKAALDPDLATNFILRPFAYLTFYANYAIGGMKPYWFRMVNIVIHAANAWLLYELLLRILRAPQTRAAVPRGSARFIAISSALLFLVHPLQIESVTYIIQRFTSLGTTFYLITVLLFVVYRTTANPVIAGWCRGCSVAALLVGMLTKEFVFTAPFMMVLLDWMLLGARLREACRRALPWIACMPLIPILIVATAAAQNEGGASLANSLSVASDPAKGDSYPLHYALTQPAVVAGYLRLLILPIGLNIDHDIALSKSPLEWRVLGPLGVIAAILAGSWVWFSKAPADPRRALTFYSVVWFFVCQSIDSSIVPLPDLMSEHRSYLPSIGIFIALVCFTDVVRTRLLHDEEKRFAIPVLVSAWVIALAVGTVSRNQAWRSTLSLWSDTAAKSPRKARVWSNLGVAQNEASLFNGAAKSFRRSIELDPGFVAPYVNLALTEISRRRFRAALQAAEDGLRLAPEFHKLHFTEGIAYAGLNDGTNALLAFDAAKKRAILTEEQQKLVRRIENIARSQATRRKRQ